MGRQSNPIMSRDRARFVQRGSEVLALNADMSRRVVVDSDLMRWQPSPSATVWRKRLHLYGAAESAQVTSIVRYDAGATFPAHDHPAGEEILVLDGVFSDEHGDWGRGCHLLNPEGFRHAPFSREGCVIFVKLQQYAGSGRRHQALLGESVEWQPGDSAGVEVRNLYRQRGFPERIWMENWAAGTSVHRHYPEGVEMLVIEGSLGEAGSVHRSGTWLRLPAGTKTELQSAGGCHLYLQSGAMQSLHSTAPYGGGT